MGIERSFGVEGGRSSMLSTRSNASQIEYRTPVASAPTTSRAVPSRSTVGADAVSGGNGLEIHAVTFSRWYRIVKRAEDLIFAIFLLLVAGPVMLLVAVLIAFDSPGPVMIRQRRFGFNNVPFL